MYTALILQKLDFPCNSLSNIPAKSIIESKYFTSQVVLITNSFESYDMVFSLKKSVRVRVAISAILPGEH